MKINSKGFSVLEGLLIIAVIAMAGVIGYLVWDNMDSDSSTETNIVQQDADLTTTNYSVENPFSGERQELSVEHPRDWTVSRYEPVEGTTYDGLEFLHIQSEKGNYLHLTAPVGLGGDCSPRDRQSEPVFRLEKKVETNTDGVYFMQYYDYQNTSIGTLNLRDLRVDTSVISGEYGASLDELRSLEEGEDGYRPCYTEYPGFGIALVTISDTSDFDLFSTLKHEDIVNDPEFEAMLRSLTVIEG